MYLLDCVFIELRFVSHYLQAERYKLDAVSGIVKQIPFLIRKSVLPMYVCHEQL